MFRRSEPTRPFCGVPLAISMHSAGLPTTIWSICRAIRWRRAPMAWANRALFGRQRKLTPQRRREIIARRDTGEETLIDIARSYNVSRL
jgi:hypothetical protein